MASSSEISDRQALPPGSRFGAFQITGWLGRGGMGSVYEAIETTTGVAAALKVVSRDVAQDRRFVERFRREMQLAAAVVHRHTVACLGSGEHGGRLWLALELVRGGSLADRLKRGPLPPDEVARLGGEIAQGLAALHAAGIVHRDLKPANVLLTEDGTAKVADFGLARGGGTDALTRTGELLGTIEYMAPEMAEGGKLVDARADLYSLGCTLYALLAGEPPFPGSSAAVIAKHIRAAPEPLARRAPKTPPELSRIIHALLAKNPADRGGEAPDVAAALGRVGRGHGHPHGEGSARGPSRRRAVALAAVAFAILPTFVVLFSRAPTPIAPPPLRASSSPTPPASHATPSPLPPWFLALDESVRPKLPPGVTPRATPEEYENARDHSVLVYVAAGSFLMGAPPKSVTSTGVEGGEEEEKPIHPVHLGAYFLGKYEVSNEQFDAFAKATGYRTEIESGVPGTLYTAGEVGSNTGAASVRADDVSRKHPRGPRSDAVADGPVVQITWADACAYGAWAGLRLPTEAEWERAAAWDGHRARIYPWGDQPLDEIVAGDLPNLLIVGAATPEVPYRRVRDGRIDVSPVRAVNMGGNAAEWILDFYDAAAYKRAGASSDDPCTLDPPAGEPPRHSVRGGSFLHAPPNARAAARGAEHSPSDDRIGFRICKSAAGAERPWERAQAALANAALGHAPRPRRVPPGLRAGKEPGEYENVQDGSILLYVPPGEFEMGTPDEATLLPADEKPRHTVELSGYFMGKLEVTRGQFAAFLAATHLATRKPHDHDGDPSHSRLPVVNVTAAEADAYAAWAGLRLPTEAEWERAAAWDPVKKESRELPWGATFGAAQFTPRSIAGNVRAQLDVEPPDGPIAVDAPLDGLSPLGCFHMAGNVREICIDRYDVAAYKDEAKRGHDPVLGAGGGARVTRGGGWRDDVSRLRTQVRTHLADGPDDETGLRVALSEDGTPRTPPPGSDSGAPPPPR